MDNTPSHPSPVTLHPLYARFGMPPPYLECSDPGKHKVRESLPHSHASPCPWGQQALDWLLPDGCRCPLEAEGGQSHHSHVSQWRVQGADTLLLGHQACDGAVHLGDSGGERVSHLTCVW